MICDSRPALPSRSVDNLAMPFKDLFRQQPTGGQILREEMNEATILAKDLPLLSTELLRELEKLYVRRRFLHFRVSAHYRESTMADELPFGELALAMQLSAQRLLGRQQTFEAFDDLGRSEIFLSLVPVG
jgi:hypothetical protein